MALKLAIEDIKATAPAEKKQVRNLFFSAYLQQKLDNKEKVSTIIFMLADDPEALEETGKELAIIGLRKLYSFYDKENKLFHPAILEALEFTQPEHLVLLMDADCRLITWDPEKEPEKDLASGLKNIYFATKKFFHAGEKVKDCITWFGHIQERLHPDYTQLSTLLRDGNKEAIQDHLRNPHKSYEYFEWLRLTETKDAAIKSFFYLQLVEGLPALFYDRYEEILLNHPFIFDSGKYQWGDKETLVMLKHKEANQFIRVGCDYYRIIQQPNPKLKGELELEQKLAGWKVGELSRDYVQKGVKIFDMIDKYKTFCNVPENDPDRYQHEIEGCYNLYFKMKYTPEPGEWPTIKMYLEHLFKNEYQDKLEIAYDYLQLVYTEPMQKLPIIALVSKERNTGKSTFLWFLKLIYGENATVIGNEEINAPFNDDFASKLIIGIDEGFIEKKTVLERIKSWSTSEKIKLHTKNKSREEITFIGKFILTSNDEKNFIMIDERENRFLVIKVPPFKKEDPFLKQKMEKEIPQFLHFLKNRKLVHKNENRLYFRTDLLMTDALKQVVKNTRPMAEKAIHDYITNYFTSFRLPILHITQEMLYRKIIENMGSYKIAQELMVRTLQDDFKAKYQESRKCKIANFQHLDATGTDTDDKVTVELHRFQGRHYTFYADDFLTHQEIISMDWDLDMYAELTALQSDKWKHEKERCYKIFEMNPALEYVNHKWQKAGEVLVNDEPPY